MSLELFKRNLSETLYKRDSKGKIRISCVEVSECNKEIIRSSGLIEGKRTVTRDKITPKSNRTLEQQSLLEFNSLVSKLKDKGYKTLSEIKPITEDLISDIGTNRWLEINLPKYNTDAGGFIKPMSAQSFSLEKSYNLTNYIVQNKLNGVRCTISIKDSKIIAKSKRGKNYNVCTRFIREEIKKTLFNNEEINKILSDYKLKLEDLVLDGELYIHGKSLQYISGICRDTNEIEDHNYLTFNIYDLCIDNLIQIKRLLLLKEIYRVIFPYVFKLLLVENTIIRENNIKVVDELHKLSIDSGYEGIMLRENTSLYKFGQRSSGLLKYKKFKDEEFEIVGKELGKRGIEDMVFICKTITNRTFKVKPKGKREEKKILWNEDNIREKLTVRYFELSKDNIPIQGVGIAVRNYE